MVFGSILHTGVPCTENIWYHSCTEIEEQRSVLKLNHYFPSTITQTKSSSQKRQLQYYTACENK
jgi:hypothetical protein